MLLRCPEPGRYLDAAGRPCEPAALPRPAAGSVVPLTLVLPAARCLFTSLQVAPAEQRHLQRLLPWKFEDSLLEPAEALHFAHAPLPAPSNETAVTAVARDWLAQLLQQARADGLQPAQVICELALLPWQDGAWSLRLQQDDGQLQCLLRHGVHQGLVCSPANLPLLLQTLADEYGALPSSLLVQGEAAPLRELLAQLPPVWRERVQERPAVWLEPQAGATCNLLQGDFAAPLPWGRWWRQWRVAALLLLGLLLSDALLTGVAIWREQQALAQLQDATRREVEAVLPGAVLVDPLLQLRRVVAAQGGDGSSGLLALLTRMAPVLAAQPGVRVEGLDYSGAQGELQLLVETADFAAVETLRAALETQGLRAELLGSSRDGARSRSRLRVQG